MSAFPDETDQATATALMGPGVFGWVLHLVLFGMITREVFDYTTSSLYRSDSGRMKGLMWSVFVLETVQIGFNVAQLFNFATNQHRDANSLLSGTIIDVIAPLPVGVIASLVQGYLLTRAAKLFRDPVAHYVYLGAIGLPLLLGFVGSLWTCIAAYKYVFQDVPSVGGISYNTALAMWQWSSAFVDVAVSLTLALVLRNQIAGFNSHTDTALRGLITLGLKTGAYTSIMAVAGAITATAFPGLSDMTTNIPEAFWVPLSGLYTLSLLATLSGRATLRNNLTGSNGGGGGGGRAARAAKTVQVDIETVVATDRRHFEIGSAEEDEFGAMRPKGGADAAVRGWSATGAQGAMGLPRGFDGGRHVINLRDEKM